MNVTLVGSLLIMTRPVNVLIAGAAVLIGLDIGGGEVTTFQMILGPLSAMLITAFANIDNDIADRAIDRVNCPTRPLPSERISLMSAVIASLVVLTVGLLSAGLCGKTALAVAGSVAIWLAIYNHWGKRQFLVGNLMVAFAGGLPLLYAGIISGPTPGRWRSLSVGFALAVGFHLAREVLKDVQDVEGDARAHAATLPLVLGVAGAVRIAAGLLLLVSILSVIPGILLWFKPLYLYGALVLIMLPGMSGFHRLWTKPDVKEAARWALATKAMMVCGLLLLWLGAR